MDFLRAYLAILDTRILITIGALILADFVLGVLVAIKNKVFEFSRLADFINTDVLFYMGGYFVVGFLAMLMPDFAAIVLGAAALIVVSLTAMVLTKLKALGLPVPEVTK
jgi:hypothetical protein